MDELVETASGPVIGCSGDRVLSFLGIPYAAPPSGALRWQPPQPPDPWTTPRKCTRFGQSAWQSQTGPLDGIVPGNRVSNMGSDYLNLNVWTPSTDGKRPVMVWIHGGAFQLGSSSLGAYNGEKLARRGDVVVVTINYRLGAFGFLVIDHPDATPNCGLLDQVAALEWVRDNIAAFGGDPSRVTLFGVSAGGGSALSLMSMPRAEGLFHRAIVQSGATTLAPTREAALTVTETFADIAGVGARDLLALQALPTDVILKTQADTAVELSSTMGMMPFHPVIDGAVMTHSWLDARIAGMHANVGLIIGTTHDEMGLFRSLDPQLPTMDDDLLRRRLSGDPNHESLIASYRSLYPDMSASRLWTAITSDQAMWVPALRIAEAHQSHQPATYMYRFDWPAADDDMGSPHGIDIPFPFDTIDVEGWDEFIAGPERAHLLAKAMQHAWAAFAYSGDPTSPNLPTWDRFDPHGRATMILGPRSRIVHDPRGPIRETWMAGAAI
jgi:para-nitrobenzyl esterase